MVWYLRLAHLLYISTEMLVWKFLFLPLGGTVDIKIFSFHFMTVLLLYCCTCNMPLLPKLSKMRIHYFLFVFAIS